MITSRLVDCAGLLAPYLGGTYRRFGRDRSGTDCYGLVWLLYADLLGIALPAFDTVSPDEPSVVDARAVPEAMEWSEVPEAAARFLDVVTFRHRGLLSHVGLAVPPGRVFHIREGATAAIVRPDHDAFLRRRERAYHRHALRA